jgi:hypothetical protein
VKQLTSGVLISLIALWAGAASMVHPWTALGVVWLVLLFACGVVMGWLVLSEPQR